MAQASIPVDLFNPGQVFACLGLVEVADLLFGDACGAFDWTQSPSRFHLGATHDTPVAAVLTAIATAKVSALLPDSADLSTSKWGVPETVVSASAPFPIALPASPATLPARLQLDFETNTFLLDVDHWGDATRRDNVKFWAGSGGYPGVALFRDGLGLIREISDAAASDPFSLAMPQSSSFRFDWRRDYIPLDAGFSPNEHSSNMTMMGYPFVELLAAIGLTFARPRRAERSKLEYRYSVLGAAAGGDLYDPIFLRAALGVSCMGFPHRDFLMQLGWPGQENQARCITNVIEETRG